MGHYLEHIALIAATLLARSSEASDVRNPAAPAASITLATPVKEWQRSIVEDHVFYCEHSTCVGTIEPNQVSQIRACKKLADDLKGIISVQIEGKDWTPEQVQACNNRSRH